MNVHQCFIVVCVAPEHLIVLYTNGFSTAQAELEQAKLTVVAGS